jgi:hypothetical protein
MDTETSGTARTDDVLARERADLERRAYGRSETPAEQLDAALAQEALIRLSHKETSPATPGHPHAEPLVEEPPADESEVHESEAPADVTTIAEENAQPRRMYGRGILALAIIGALVVGAAIAGGVAAANRRVAANPDPASSDVANQLPGTNFPAANVGSADRWFSTSQSVTDKYPNIPAQNMRFLPSSTRLVENSNVVGSVWVAKSTTPANGYCLMTISPEASDRTRTGTAQCVSAAAFLSKGLTLHNNGVSIRWTPTEITATALP